MQARNVKNVKEDVLFLQLRRLIFSLSAFALAVLAPNGEWWGNGLSHKFTYGAFLGLLVLPQMSPPWCLSSTTCPSN